VVDHSRRFLLCPSPPPQVGVIPQTDVAASGNGKKDHAPPVAGQPRCLGPGDRRCLDPVNGPIYPMEKSLEPTANQRGKKVIHE
jgi:hypothetical protein